MFNNVNYKLGEICETKKSNIIFSKTNKGKFPLFGASGSIVKYIDTYNYTNFIFLPKMVRSGVVFLVNKKVL